MRRILYSLLIFSALTSIPSYSDEPDSPCTSQAARYATMAYGIAKHTPDQMEDFLFSRPHFFSKDGASIYCLLLLKKHADDGQLKKFYDDPTLESDRELAKELSELIQVLPAILGNQSTAFNESKIVKAAAANRDLLNSLDWKGLHIDAFTNFFLDIDEQIDLTDVSYAQSTVDDLVTEYYFTTQYNSPIGVIDFIYPPSLEHFKEVMIKAFQQEKTRGVTKLRDELFLGLELKKLESMSASTFAKKALLLGQRRSSPPIKIDSIETISSTDEDQYKLIELRIKVLISGKTVSIADSLKLHQSRTGWNVDLSSQLSQLQDRLQ